jgi:mycoredoxin
VTPSDPRIDRVSDVTPSETSPDTSGPGLTPGSDPGVPDASAPVQVQLYWRPGCGFCSSLTRSLDRIGLAYDMHNIWDDEDAAVFVRRVANGNETVPTVRVGDVALINPTAHEVMDEVATRAPSLVPTDYEPPQPGAIGRALRRMLGG